MPNIEQGNFQVDFESLIKVVATNLYANPKAAIRELIQNANDACARRAAIDGFEPSIHFMTDVGEKKLIVEDNGIGMIHEEVVQHLSTIGSGKTRFERQRLSNDNPQAARMLIGQFGIGFLSTFIIAERVVVETRSLDLGLPVHWSCEGTIEYQIGRGERELPGTQVTLSLKPAQYDLLEEDVLRAAIVHYADLISYPIYLNDFPQPINRMQAPWHYDAAELEYAKFVERRYGALPLAHRSISVDREDLKLDGIIFIPPRSHTYKGQLRSTDLFQQRMFVAEDPNLLPDWAGFICAVLDCSTVELVASRDNVMKEGTSYQELREYLSKVVTEFVRQLAENERLTFLEVINHHDWRILYGALKNDDFFDQIKDLVPLPTDMGPMTMTAYLQRVPSISGNTKNIYYKPGERLVAQQQSSLFKVQGIPIIQADQAVKQFLYKYTSRIQDLILRELESGVKDLMKEVQGEDWRAIEGRCQELGIIAKVVSFDPSEMVSIAVRKEEYDQTRLVEQLFGNTRGLSDFMDRVGTDKSDMYEVALNASNPIIQQLAKYSGDPTVFNTALQAIQASGLLAADVELTADLNKSVFRAQMRIIELLLEQASRISTGQLTGPYNASQFVEAQDNEIGQKLNKMAVAQFQLGNMQRAETLLLRAVEIPFQERYAALINLGSLYAHQNRYEEAKPFLVQAIESRPQQIDAYAILGRILESQEHWTEAIKVHERIRELSEEYQAPAQVKICLCLLHSGQIDLANEKILSLYKQYPKDAQVCLALGQVKEQQKQWAEALIAYQRAATLDPELDLSQKVNDLLALSGARGKIGLEIENLKISMRASMTTAVKLCKILFRTLFGNSNNEWRAK